MRKKKYSKKYRKLGLALFKKNVLNSKYNTLFVKNDYYLEIKWSEILKYKNTFIKNSAGYYGKII